MIRELIQSKWTSCLRHYYVYMSRRMTKPTKWHVRPVKTRISLGILPVWSESSLSALWVARVPRFHHADSKDSESSLGAQIILLVLSLGGSYVCLHKLKETMHVCMHACECIYLHVHGCVYVCVLHVSILVFSWRLLRQSPSTRNRWSVCVCMCVCMCVLMTWLYPCIWLETVTSLTVNKK